MAETAAQRERDVVVRDLVRRAPGGRVVLDHLTATFPAGQVSVVHGANGSGKSMLARVIAGVDRPDHGSVTRPRAAAFLLPERAAVLPGCSARTLAAALVPSVGNSAGGWSARLDDALESLGSSHGARTSMSRLSKGNLQKSYLAVAYALRPTLAVLDEPITGLDAPAAVAAGALMRSLAAEGGVVVVTGHRPTAFGDTNQALVGGRLDAPREPMAATYLVDLAPAPEVRRLLDAAALGSAVLDSGTDASGHIVQVTVDADGLDHLLRAALAHDLKITRVAEVAPW